MGVVYDGDCACQPPCRCATIATREWMMSAPGPLFRRSSTMSTLRRACVLLMSVGLLGCVTLWSPAQIQVQVQIKAAAPAPVGTDPKAPGKMTAAISLPIDSKAQ